MQCLHPLHYLKFYIYGLFTNERYFLSLALALYYDINKPLYIALAYIH
jgi:hypothetical protein